MGGLLGTECDVVINVVLDVDVFLRKGYVVDVLDLVGGDC